MDRDWCATLLFELKLDSLCSKRVFIVPIIFLSTGEVLFEMIVFDGFVYLFILSLLGSHSFYQNVNMITGTCN